MAVTAMAIPFLELARMGLYWERVSDWLDNWSYVEIAHIIRFGGVPSEQHFWGFPAVIALTEVIFSASGIASLVAVSLVCSMAACLLMYRLYGAEVTVAFLILCPEWVRLSIVGGSEPLFLLLLLGSWLAFRSDHSLTAVLLASFATTVRPVGGIAVCAFAFTLLIRRDWRRLAISISLAVGIGVAYLAWLRTVSGDPLINLRLYATDIWPSGNPLSLPLVRLAKSIVRLQQIEPWTRLIQPLFCIAFISFGIFVLWMHARAMWQGHTAELAFVIGYLGFSACYNEIDLASFFPRLMIPVYPFLLFAARDWLPKSRKMLWILVLFSALIASVDLVGLRAVFGFSLHR